MSLPTDAIGQYPAQTVKNIGVGDVFDFFALLGACLLLAWETWDLAAERPEMESVAILLGLNGAAAIAGLWVSLRRRFPTLLASFYFSYIFFSIAPLQQIRVKFDPIFNNDSVLFATVFLCLMLTAIALGALYFRARPASAISGPRGFFSRSSYDCDFHPLSLFIAVAVVSCALLALYGSSLLISRETSSAAIADQFDRIGFVFVSACLNAFVFIGAVIGVLAAKFNNNRPWLLAFLLLLAIAELISNPIATARFRASELIVFALLAFFGWNNARLLLAFLLTGVAVSPIFNMFRTAIWGEVDRRSFDTFFAHIDFDAFAMTSYAIHHVGQAAYGYGSNLLATLLFFVPRAIWTDKGLPVGILVFPQVRYYRAVGTDVLASPPIAEGFYDYGYIGAFLLTAALFVAFVFLERRAQAAEPSSPLRLMACLLPMLAILALRGTLTVAYSEFWGNFVALTIAVALARLKIRVGPPLVTLQRARADAEK